MAAALYGPDGFFMREDPTDHFRTSVSTSPLFALAIRRLAGLVDDALGRPDPFDLVDVGTATGALLAALPDVPERWRLTGIDLNGRWPATIPPVHGLLFANEWLDDVPLDIVFDGRLVEVSEAGQERLGAAAPAEVLDWVRRWWPDRRRSEVGLTRDLAWAGAVAAVQRGLAVAVDYGHTRADRRTTLTGYRDGRQVPPVPDASMDLTAHVALDSCAALTSSRLLTQREALSLLGISALPPLRAMASEDPRGYLSLLQSAGQAAALLDPRGLGAFGWLVQAVGIEDPLKVGA